MKVRRTTTTATLLATLVAGGILLASAGTASAQDRTDRAPGPVPGMAAMHRQMTEQNPGMARMHQLMTDGPRQASRRPLPALPSDRPLTWSSL